VAGDGHDGEVVVAGEAQIVYGAVAQVVEGKVSQFCLLHSTAPLEFVIPCKIIDRLSPAQEYSVGVKSTGQIDEHFPKMMSICLTWFPIGGLGEPNI